MLETSIFSFSDNVFKRPLFQGHENMGLFLKIEHFTKQFWLLMTLKKKAFEIIVGEGENAGY